LSVNEKAELLQSIIGELPPDVRNVVESRLLIPVNLVEKSLLLEAARAKARAAPELAEEDLKAGTLSAACTLLDWLVGNCTGVPPTIAEEYKRILGEELVA